MVATKPDKVANSGAGVVLKPPPVNYGFKPVTSDKIVAIIGAGASGLTAARQAVNYGYTPVIFEKSIYLGGIWSYSDDPEDRSVSFSTTMLHSKEFSAFSDFTPPDKFGTFMHHSEVLEYLNSYVDHFDLRKFIRFECCVTSVKRSDDWKETGNWILDCHYSDGRRTKEITKAVLVCTGMYSKPLRPVKYQLEDEFQGKVVHSSEVKHVGSFRDKVVVVVGFGNSAIQLATDLAPIARQVYLSIRKGAWLMPTLTASSEPWDLTFNSRINAFGRRFTPDIIQNSSWEGELNGRFDHATAGILPDHRFLAANLTFSKNGFIDHLVSQRIKIKPNLLSFTKTGVELVDKTIIDNVDQVIFCTGYQFDFNFIENGKLIVIEEGNLHLYKHMYLPELHDIAKHSNFAVLGHIHSTGPLFPVAEMQARFFFAVLSKKYRLKSTFLMKSSIKHQKQMEDYTGYMNNLASKIGVKPSVCSFLTSPKFGLKCVFGPNLPYQYRLRGEHTWEDAKNAIMTSDQRIRTPPSNRYFKRWQLDVILLCCL